MSSSQRRKHTIKSHITENMESSEASTTQNEFQGRQLMSPSTGYIVGRHSIIYFHTSSPCTDFEPTDFCHLRRRVPLLKFACSQVSWALNQQARVSSPFLDCCTGLQNALSRFRLLQSCSVLLQLISSNCGS